MAERVFVTGATGKVGRPLIAALVARGDTVLGLTRSSDKVADLEGLGAAAIVGSLEDDEALLRGLAEATLVIHLAGGVRGPGAMTAERLNVEGTRRLVAAAAALAMQPTVIFASTVAVYGDRSGLWLEEDMPVLPNTSYGQSKAAAESMLLDSGLPVRIARLAGVYGPGFAVLMADRMQRGRAWLPGEGRNVVPMIHVDDAVAALICIADRGGDGQIYNVSDRRPLSTKEFYELVHRHAGGAPARFWSTWVPSYLQERLAWENERLASRLGRMPRVTPDVLKLFRASSRMSVTRLADELEFQWRYPDPEQGVAACF